MEGTSESGRLDGPDHGQVGEHQPPRKRIGGLGKSVLTNPEKEALRYIGRCIARLGHTLVIVPARGTADLLREGVEAEGGETQELASGVIESAAHTLVYPDTRLLSRLLTAYPNLRDQANVSVIPEGDLPLWVDAITQLLEERGLTPPTE